MIKIQLSKFWLVRCSLLILLSVGMQVMAAQPAAAQQMAPTPQLISVFPTGGRAGEEMTVKIVEQVELEFADSLIFSHPGITAKPVLRDTNRYFPKPVPVRNEFSVRIAPEVPPGTYEVRAECEYGISNPRRFVVSGEPEYLEQEPNNDFENANRVSVNSTANGLFESEYDYYQFQAEPNASLIIQCIAERIDSGGDPVVTVFGPDREIIARNLDSNGKDALVSFVAEEQGTYTIRVNDLTFVSQGGQGTTPYRLSVSDRPWIDFADPPLLQDGVKSKVKLYGRNLGGGLSGFLRNGVELEVVTVEILPHRDSDESDLFADQCLDPCRFHGQLMSYRYENSRGHSNEILLNVIDTPISPETKFSDSPLTVADGPLEILGTFETPGSPEIYRFQARKDQPLWIEVVSQRMGIQTDPLLLIQSVTKDKEGKESFRTLSTVDDVKPLASPYRFRIDTEDPAFLFSPPADGDYQIVITDQFNLPANYCGPNFYRLRFRRPEPSATLVAVPGLERGLNDNNNRPLKICPCIVRRHSAVEIQVFAYRAPGFNEEIQLTVEGLPAGVECKPAIMNRHDNQATLLLIGGEDLKAGHTTASIRARVIKDGKSIKLSVAVAELTTNSVGNEPCESRLADRFVVSTDPQLSMPGRIELGIAEIETSRGGKLTAKAKFIKTDEATGTINQGFVYGLPRQVSRNNNNLPVAGSEVSYNFDFRQDVPDGEYSAFIRGYYESNVGRFEQHFKKMEAEQKRITAIVREVESEYRKVSQNRPRLEQSLSQKRQSANALKQKLAKQSALVKQKRVKIDAANTQEASLNEKIAKAKATLTRLQSQSDSETEEEKKNSALAELASQKQTLAQLQDQLASTMNELTATNSELESATQQTTKTESDLESAESEIQKMADELEKLRATEKELQEERSLGQTVKREVDQEFQLARQAAQPRRRRFYVYSKPIDVSVAKLPVQLQLSETNFSLQQGETAKFQLTAKRKFDFKGEITLQLRSTNGGTGWKLTPAKLEAGQDKIALDLTAENYAKPGSFEGEITARMRFGNTNLTETLPVKVTVEAKEKK